MADDLVQETLVRVLAALPRIEPGMLEPYAIVTARNLVATMWRDARPRSGVTSTGWSTSAPPEPPDEDLLASEEQAAITEALGGCRERERETLLAHEVAGQDTRSPGRGARLDGRRRGRAAEPDTGPAAGGVPARTGGGRAARPIGAGRCCWPSPAAIAGANARSTRRGTCSSASCAPV